MGVTIIGKGRGGDEQPRFSLTTEEDDPFLPALVEAMTKPIDESGHAVVTDTGFHVETHGAGDHQAMATDESLDEIYRDVLALASAPLPEITDEDVARYQERTGRVRPLTASRGLVGEGTVAALQAAAAISTQSNETLRSIVQASLVGPEKESDEHLLAALDAIGKLAAQPHPAAPDFHVHMPKQDFQVDVSTPDVKSQIDVHVPKPDPQPAPVTHVHVPEQAAPVINVPEQPPSVTHVHVPEQPAPLVKVENKVESPAPAPPRSVRVEKGADGVTRYVTE